MKVTVEESCIGCGLCESICPKVFKLNEDNFAEVVVNHVESGDEKIVNEAEENCPVSAIKVRG
ncbi:ferredoxin [Proteinivorax tanatarense]|uniref:Ferredoxin n=1 Tax=Proteinivorax tanatarense TaxID=1260629 RepID=A0AAU7VPQ5_9FIRM